MEQHHQESGGSESESETESGRVGGAPERAR